jgi:hypothetical protein
MIVLSDCHLLMMIGMGRAIDKVLSQPPPASSRATPYRQPPPLCHDSDRSKATLGNENEALDLVNTRHG